MKLLWDERGWNDYLSWQDSDRKTLRKINALLKDIQRSPYEGIGKPEPLKENLSGWWSRRSGWWSRRIDSANRIVYREKDGVIVIASCKGHYDN